MIEDRPVSLEFLDGERDVPRYFADLVAASGVDFHAATFEEITRLVSEIGMRRHLNSIVTGMIRDHRRDHN